ncbi:MAG: hypothetical protein RIT15_1759, partial [Pseudomonadota bacterium]
MRRFALRQRRLIFIVMKSNFLQARLRERVRLFFAKRKAQAPAPKTLWVLLVVGLLTSGILSTVRGKPQASADALGWPPSNQGARLIALDEPVAFAKMLNLVTQAHDVQPGLSLAYGQLNYDQLTKWL